MSKQTLSTSSLLILIEFLSRIFTFNLTEQRERVSERIKKKVFTYEVSQHPSPMTLPPSTVKEKVTLCKQDNDYKTQYDS